MKVITPLFGETSCGLSALRVSLKETLPDGSLESDPVGEPRGSGLKQLKQHGQEESIYPFRNEITTGWNVAYRSNN